EIGYTQHRTNVDCRRGGRDFGVHSYRRCRNHATRRATGLLLYHSKKLGVTILVPLVVILVALQFANGSLVTPTDVAVQSTPASAGMTDIAEFFFKVGAIIFGG